MAIAVIEEDRFPSISTAQDMIDGARILNAHGRSINQSHHNQKILASAK
jgi:hypothetical protein